VIVEVDYVTCIGVLRKT